MRKNIKARPNTYLFSSENHWGKPIIVARHEWEAIKILIKRMNRNNTQYTLKDFHEDEWKIEVRKPLERVQNPYTGRYEKWPKD